MTEKTKTPCSKCNKHIHSHKPATRCHICCGIFHPKCSFLTPSDIIELIEQNMHDSWTCHTCLLDIFPNFVFDMADGPRVDRVNIRQKCNVCLKNGKNLENCEICHEFTHPRCFSGPIGCKHCMREALPGFDADRWELFQNLDEYAHKIFNPFDHNSDIFNLGNIDDDDNSEHTHWSACSDLLNNCNYIELDNVSKSRNSDLKVFSLNIRSIYGKIGDIRDDRKHFLNFDVLCFNETCCNPANLPFGGEELDV